MTCDHEPLDLPPIVLRHNEVWAATSPPPDDYVDSPAGALKSWHRPNYCLVMFACKKCGLMYWKEFRK